MHVDKHLCVLPSSKQHRIMQLCAFICLQERNLTKKLYCKEFVVAHVRRFQKIFKYLNIILNILLFLNE